MHGSVSLCCYCAQSCPLSRLLLDARENSAGFSSVDIAMEELVSVYPNMTYKLFLRTPAEQQ